MLIDRFFKRHPGIELIAAVAIIFTAVGLGLYWFLAAAKII